MLLAEMDPVHQSFEDNTSKAILGSTDSFEEVRCHSYRDDIGMIFTVWNAILSRSHDCDS